MKKAKAKMAKTAKTAKPGDGAAPVAALVAAIDIMTEELVRNTNVMNRLAVAIEAGLPVEQARNPEPAASEQ